MEQPQEAPNPSRTKLAGVRETLLTLHKALLDSERTAYEIVNGPIGSPSAFLQLLINDGRFAWLRPITTLLVQIDETLAAKNPPAGSGDFEQLIIDTRALLSRSTESNDFWKYYSASVERDPAVALLHRKIEEQLA
jgi:hypothetical protein